MNKKCKLYFLNGQNVAKKKHALKGWPSKSTLKKKKSLQFKTVEDAIFSAFLS